MKIVRIIFHFIQSFFKLYFNFLFKRKIDILFYYPQNFNVTSKKIRSLSLMIEECKKHNLSFLVIEEPDYFINSPRNKKSVKFDFFFLVISIFRKIIRSTDDPYQKDKKIGQYLSFLFLGRNKVKNIVTVSQSLQFFLRQVYKKANFYDYQHGIISNKFEGLIFDGKVAPNLIQNQIKPLLFGNQVKQMLINFEGGQYFKNNSYVIGGPFENYKSFKPNFNNNILFSLQFTKSHSADQNKRMFVKTIELFEKISDTNKNVKIYLKHHPRFNNCIDISSFYNYDFVLDSPNDINKCFELCSLHITEYSTMVFDGLSNGIPSLFTRFCSEFSLFDKDYNFPYSNSNLLDCLDKLHKDDLFNKILISQTAVSKDLYEPFNENLFVKIVSK